MNHYDTIIIGGGLAGSTLGYLLRKEDKNVLIIEKQDIKNKNKLCGGLLTNKSYNLLLDLFGNDIKSLIKNSYKDGNLINNNSSIMIENIDTYSIYRKKLDDYILDKYVSIGGKIIDNTTYQEIDIENKTLKVNDIYYSYFNIVGADGIFSQLRKEVTKRNQRNNFALEILNNDIKFNSVNIYFFDNFKGYAWIIPSSDYNMIGIGNVSSISKIDNEFNSYLNSIGISNIDNKRGAFLPTGDDILLMSDNNIFFIGDSAGLISPITGEGIYYAMYSAYVLSKNLNSNYPKVMKVIIKNIKKDLFYMKFVYNDKLRNYLFKYYNKNIIITKLINRFSKHIL